MRSRDVLEIICGQGGLNVSKSPDFIRDTDVVAMESITMEHDTWQKDGGAVKFNSVAITGNNDVIALKQWWDPSALNYEVLCAAGDKILVFDPAAGTLSKTVYTAISLFNRRDRVFTEGYNGSTPAIYYFNRSDYPIVYTGGTTVTTMTSAVGTVTADSATDTFTRTAHGLANDTPVMFYNSGGALPTGVSSNFPYFTRNVAANTFQISLSAGGVALNFTSNGTGTHTVHRCLLPADWRGGSLPAWSFLHNSRLYGGGNLTPHEHGVYASVLNNHSDFLNSGTLYWPVYPGEGERIVGGISWRNKAYIFKYPRGIYVLDDTSIDTADWGWKRVSRYVGAVSQGSLVEADDDVYFISPHGYIHSLSAVQEYGDVKSSAIKAMELSDYVLSRMYLPQDSLAHGVYYEKKKKVIFSYVSLDSLSQFGDYSNALMIGLDIHRSYSDQPGSMKDAQLFVSTRDEYNGLAQFTHPTTRETTIMAGTINGFIYKLDQSARSKDSAGYTASFQTKDFYPYGSERNANLRELEIVFARGSSNNAITIKVYRDGTLSDTKTLTDSDRVMRLHGDCLRFYLTGENSTINQSFSVSKLIVRYVPGNWRKHS